MSEIQPHGGTLVDRVLTDDARQDALQRMQSLPTIRLDARAASDLYMISVGAFSPLHGFMGRSDYERVVDELRLADGTVWSLPVVLRVSKDQAADIRDGDEVALVDGHGGPLGVMRVEERFAYDKEHEAQEVYRTTEEAHPGVAALMQAGEVALGGPVYRVSDPTADAFASYRHTPAQTRAAFRERGWRRVVGFQTRNPIHRAHEYIQKCALEIVDGIMLHPLVGATKRDDVPASVRLRSYEVIFNHYYPQGRVLLAVFPASMRYAGPREAVFHALCRKNYGCTHFIVGRDHAGVGDYYGTYDSQRIFDHFTPAELGITPLRFDHAFYCKACGNMATAKTCPHAAADHVVLSGTKVRAMLRSGEVPPPEFTRPEVAQVLIEGMRERQEAG